MYDRTGEYRSFTENSYLPLGRLHEVRVDATNHTTADKYLQSRGTPEFDDPSAAVDPLYTVTVVQKEGRSMSSQSRDISESRPLIAVLLIASMLTIMLDTVLSPALPGLRANFSNVENIDFFARIILTFPSIFVAVCAPIYGVLVDRVGRTRILYIR